MPEGRGCLPAAGDDSEESAGKMQALRRWADREYFPSACALSLCHVSQERCLVQAFSFAPEVAYVTSVGADVSNAPVEVYTLGGVKVGSSLNGLQKGIYIIKQGGTVKKVMK